MRVFGRCLMWQSGKVALWRNSNFRDFIEEYVWWRKCFCYFGAWKL